MRSRSAEEKEQLLGLATPLKALWLAVKEVAFLGCVHTVPHIGWKSFKNPTFRAWIGIYVPNAQNVKTCILSKLLHRIKPNFAQCKDHQIRFVCRPNRRITNPRWRMAAILKTSKSRHMSSTDWPIGRKFGTVVQIDPPNRIGSYHFRFLKTEMADGRPQLWKIKKWPHLCNGFTDLLEFGMMKCIDLL